MSALSSLIAARCPGLVTLDEVEDLLRRPYQQEYRHAIQREIDWIVEADAEPFLAFTKLVEAGLFEGGS